MPKKKYVVKKRGNYVYAFRASEKKKISKNALARYSIKKRKMWGATKHFWILQRYLTEKKIR